MNGFLAYAKELLLVLALAGGVWAVVQVVLTLVWLGSIGGLRLLLTFRGIVRSVPDGASFLCRDGWVSVLFYDRVSDEDRMVKAWFMSRPSLLRWSDRTKRPARTIRRRVDAEIAWRSAVFVTVFVPLVAGTVWLAVHVHWTWIYATVFALAHQWFVTSTRKLFVIKPGTMIVPTGLLAFDRLNVWDLSVTALATIYFGYGLFSLAVLLLAARSEEPSPAVRR